VARLYARPIQELPPIPLDAPRRGLFLVDGAAAEQLPAGRPLILQQVAREGTVLGSWWLESTVRLPSEPWADPRRKTRTALRVGGLAAIGLGGIAWGVAAASHAAHEKTGVDRPPSQREGYRDARRGSTIAGAGLIIGGSAALGVSFTAPLR